MADTKNDRRIVVGVDGSEPSRLALRWALRQAELTGATVEAVHAWDIPLHTGIAPVMDVSAEHERLVKLSQQILDDALAEVADECPTTIVHTRAIPGHPAHVLLRAAEGAELLVVGCRGHGAFVGALLGSVSQYCVHHAICPVAVIRAPHGQ